MTARDEAGYWLAVDGIDGVGKTTLCHAICDGRDSYTLVPEFSHGPLGQLLQNSVKGDVRLTIMGDLPQSLLFLAEYHDRVTSLVLPEIDRGKVVVTDRGTLSKLAFQAALLSEDLGLQDAQHVVRTLLGSLPSPDLTLDLHADMDTVVHRLRTKGRSPTNRQMRFLMTCRRLMTDLASDIAPVLCIATTSIAPKTVAIHITDLVESRLIRPPFDAGAPADCAP